MSLSSLGAYAPRLNSTMVRLQLTIFFSSLPDELKSQFHYGSITTLLRERLNLSLFFVSIPLWFDYNIRSSKKLIRYGGSLNSTMVRLQLFIPEKENINDFGLSSTMVRLQLIILGLGAGVIS